MKYRNRMIPLFMSGFLTVSLLISGCLPARQGVGARIDPKHRIDLKTGSHEGVFETEDLVLTYRYRHSEESAALRLDGELQYAAKLTYTYSTLKSLFFWVYFVDSSNKVLDRQILLQASELDGFAKQAVQKETSLPPGADAVAFGYSGKTIGDALLGEGIDFWFSPF